MISLTIGSPKPVPSSLSVAMRSNLSNIFSRYFSVIPGPVSEISQRISLSNPLSLILTYPPSGVYFIALFKRLIITSANAHISPDGINWQQTAHGLTIAASSGAGKRYLAYSRVGTKWIVITTTGLAESTNNGFTWSAITGAPTVSSLWCDGYGTWVGWGTGGTITTTGYALPLWLSVDNGVNWTRFFVEIVGNSL